MIETNALDRFRAWMSDPDKPASPTLQDAFIEGFTQAMEWISGEPRVRGSNEAASGPDA